jgi:hypothetical protein
VLGRRLIGRDNKKAMLAQFTSFRLSRDILEEGDKEIANREFPIEDLDSNKDDYMLKRRHAYSYKVKLAVINYFQTI